MTGRRCSGLVEIDAGYENVAAECPDCLRRSVFNRVSDIGHVGLIDNQRVVCSNPDCAAIFDIGGDLVNSAHEMLLLDSCEFLREKRYMQAVLSATTAYEQFFAHFLLVELVLRPSRRDGQSIDDDVAWINQTADLLRARTAQFTFDRMRRVFLRVASKGVSPKTLAEAEANVAAIPSRPPELSSNEIVGACEEPLRALLIRVQNATIAKLRNDVVHKTAYRPTMAETQAAVNDACETIFALSRHFDLSRDECHLNERVD